MIHALQLLLQPASYWLWSWLSAIMLTNERKGNCYTHMGFPLWRLPSHEGVGEAILRMTFPVAQLIVAFKLAGAPAVVEGAVAATLLAKLHIIINHFIWVCMKKTNMHISRDYARCQHNMQKILDTVTVCKAYIAQFRLRAEMCWYYTVAFLTGCCVANTATYCIYIIHKNVLLVEQHSWNIYQNTHHASAH